MKDNSRGHIIFPAHRGPAFMFLTSGSASIWTGFLIHAVSQGQPCNKFCEAYCYILAKWQRLSVQSGVYYQWAAAHNSNNHHGALFNSSAFSVFLYRMKLTEILPPWLSRPRTEMLLGFCIYDVEFLSRQGHRGAESFLRSFWVFFCC